MQKEFSFYSLHTGHEPDKNRVKFEIKNNDSLELEFNYNSMKRKNINCVIDLKTSGEELENKVRELFKDSEEDYDDIYFFRADIYILNSIKKLARKPITEITVEEFFKNLDDIFQKQKENTYFEYVQIRKP